MKLKTRKPVRLIAVAVTLVIGLAAFVGYNLYAGQKNAGTFDEKAAILREAVFEGNTIYGRLKYDTEDYGYIVFMSICDTLNRAEVFHGTGDTLKMAWENAAQKTRNYVGETKYDTAWVKADVVNKMRVVNTEEFPGIIEAYQSNFLREGIAFDAGFDCAFLEAELNSSNLISYQNDKINENSIKNYLNKRGERFAGVQSELTLFTTIGFFCGEDKTALELYSNETDYGRRLTDAPDDALISGLVARSSDFLLNIVKNDGQFIYGYYPISDREISSYNILRHAGTVWCLINQYAITRDDAMLPKIKSLLDYLTDCVVYDSSGAAFVVDMDENEVKLGGNGISILAYISYMDITQTDEYAELVRCLADGIMTLTDLENGTYYHVLNYPDLTRKAEFRTVYYDGEATYALARAYGYTGDEKYLDAAKQAIENFIKNDYQQYRDHWVAYSVNEVTKYYPDERFLEFGLKNAQENLKRISRLDPAYSTTLELLMATFELYDRVIEAGTDLEYLGAFDDKYFVETTLGRVRTMINSYFYPEYAMYMPSPSTIEGSFYVRRDAFRVRIDDVQHVIGGYHKFIANYDKLMAYKEALGVQ